MKTGRYAVLIVFAALAIARVTLAQQAQSPAPTPAVEKYVIEEAATRAAPQDGAMQGTMKLQVRLLDDGDTWIPLFSGNVGVTVAEASGGGWFTAKPTLMRRGETVGILLRGKGHYSVELGFATALTSGPQQNSAEVPMVPALTGVCEVTLPGANLDVTLSPELPHQVQTLGKSTLLTVYGSADGAVQMSWKPGPEAREVERIAFAEQSMRMHVSPGLLRVDTEIVYSLLQGRMPRAQVEVPAGYSILRVEGENLRMWDIERQAEGRAVITAALLDETASRSTLRLALEKTLEPVPVQIEAPQVQALDVTREKGTIAVSVEKGLQAEIVDRSNIAQVNLSEMADGKNGPVERYSLAMRYLARPFRVTLRVSTIEPKVYGEVTCLTVASLERFRQYWTVDYEIRNAGVFQLKLGLAPGMKLISLRGENINNQSLDAATNVLTVDLRSKAEGEYSLALQTSSEVAEPAAAVLPMLGLIGAERQWGTVAVAADTGTAVEARVMKGISQIDLSELATLPNLTQMVREQRSPEPTLAFRYLSLPADLVLSTTRIRPELKVNPLHMIQLTRKNLRYQSIFNYQIKKAGVFQLRLHLPPELRGSLTVTGPKVEDYSYEPVSSTLTVQLTEKTLGDVTVEIQTEALLGKELPKPGRSDVFPIPPIYALDCEQERGHLALATTESVRLKRSGEGGALHDVDVQEIPPALRQRTASPKLAFRIIESPWTLDIEATSISPRIQAQTFNYIRFGEDYLIGASTIDFTIQYAGVSEFRVRLPEGVTEPNIRGENIKIQEKVTGEESSAEADSAGAEPDGELWRVELQGEVKDSYQLIFEYTIDLDPDRLQRTFTGPRVSGDMPEVEREIGYLAVTGDPSLELTPLADELKDLTPVDEEEIPVKFRRLPPSVAQQIGRETVPILFAFRYLGHPYLLALSSIRHDEADVVTAVVESCKLDTTLTAEGNRITTMLADVRSRYQPFLEIELPEGARLWHALVQGRRVRPLTDTVSGREVTKVPIAQVQGLDGPVRVELQWEEMGGSELGRWQTVRLEVPSLMGVRVLRLGWVLQLPREVRVVSTGGTLQSLPSDAYFEPALREMRPAGGSTTPGVGGIGDGQFEFQEGSNFRVLQGRSGARESERAAMVHSGQKPELPRRCYFQGLILNPDIAARATATCTTAPALTITLAALVLVTFAICAVFWTRSGLSAPVAFGVLAVAALILAGVHVVMEEDYSVFLIALFNTLWITAVLLALIELARQIGSSTPEKPDAEDGPQPPSEPKPEDA